MTALEGVPGNGVGAPREERPSDETHANGFASQSSSYNPAKENLARLQANNYNQIQTLGRISTLLKERIRLAAVDAGRRGGVPR